MELSWYVDEVNFALTSGVLECELDDSQLEKCVMRALKEINRYYDSTRSFVTKAATCIDLSSHPDISSISAIYSGTGTNSTSTDTSTVTSYTDPNAVQMWSLAGGSGYYNPNFATRYATYLTMQSLTNTMSTDLAFKQDIKNQKLYINSGSNSLSGSITVEYIPKLTDPSDIVSEYWTDILLRMSIAYAKIAVGRVRTRYTQSGASWTQDGDKILEEGTTELNAIRERLLAQSNYSYPVD